MRACGPESLRVRISWPEWMPGGWELDDAVAFSHELKKLGCDWIDASSARLYSRRKFPIAGLTCLRRRIRKKFQIATIAVGLITSFRAWRRNCRQRPGDMVALARLMWNPPGAGTRRRRWARTWIYLRSILRVRPGHSSPFIDQVQFWAMPVIGPCVYQ